MPVLLDHQHLLDWHAVCDDMDNQVFFDVKVEGKPAGRITVELFDDVPVGSQRFADLAVGSQGVNYRLNRFDYVVDVSGGT